MDAALVRASSWFISTTASMTSAEKRERKETDKTDERRRRAC